MKPFKPFDFKIKEEGKTAPVVSKVQSEEKSGAQVRAFEFERISRPGEGTYQSVKSKYGPLAATDPDRIKRGQKDSRFQLSALLRDPLSIEDEERRVIDEKVRLRVEALAAEIRSSAIEKGYADGLKKGHEEAFKKFQKEGGERLAQFEAFLASCDEAKTRIFEANEKFLVELVFRIARMLLLKELSTDREYVLRLTRDLLERVGVRENIKIRIHPEELATAGMIKDGLEKSLGSLKNLNIESSPNVSRGGCLLETEWNAIDATIETQLNGIHEAIASGIGGGGEPGGTGASSGEPA